MITILGGIFGLIFGLILLTNNKRFAQDEYFIIRNPKLRKPFAIFLILTGIARLPTMCSRGGSRPAWLKQRDSLRFLPCSSRRFKFQIHHKEQKTRFKLRAKALVAEMVSDTIFQLPPGLPLAKSPE